jgi:ligand-binding sensor domain-containing protein/signal transduction histidine kinase
LNTFLDCGSARCTLRSVAAILVFCALPCAKALSPNKTLSQYILDRWGEEQGFTGGPIYAIAQTRDGYLWLGAERGLIRFDGLAFQLYPAANGSPAGPVLGLLADRSGDLWVRVQGPQFYRYHDGFFQNILPGLPVLETDVTAMCAGQDDSILFAGLSNGIVRYSKGKLVALAARGDLPRLIISMVETPDGKVWLGTREQGVFYLENGHVHAVSQGVADKKINSLLALDATHVWIGTDHGVATGGSAGFSRSANLHSLDRTQSLALIRDRDSNLWIGTPKGLARVGPSGELVTEANLAASVTAIFEDREGNLWVGTDQGLERVRDSAFTSYSSSSGLPTDNNGPIYVDDHGRTWFAPLQGGLYWMKDGQTHAVNVAGLKQEVVYSISGSEGEVWLGRRTGGLTRIRTGANAVSAETYTTAKGLAQNSVYAVHENRDGSVWAGTTSSGVSVLKGGRFTNYTVASGLLSNSIAAILESSDGTMWFGTPDGLSSFSGERWKNYTSRDGLPPGNVTSLFEDSTRTLWIGTENGLAILRNGRLESPRDAPLSLHEPILGIREDRAGSIWIATKKNVLRFDRQKMLRSWPRTADVRDYGPADGLRSEQGVRRYESVVSDSLGRIWFSTGRGISFVDPRPLADSSVPAIVYVNSLSADGSAVALAEPIRVPAPHQRITLGYTGLSLSVPSRVMFRYRLDGFDQSWTDPTPAREAVYTNLDSGPYTFRVIASNSDGVWNSSESLLKFQIEPAVWQTWWFRLLILVACSAVVLVFVRLRVTTLTRELGLRFEERLAERTRIAQELHDTLLQGFVSASMQLHVANDRLEADSPAKPMVGRVLELMRQMIDEGRNALRGLRSSRHNPVNLERAFSEVRQEFPVDSQIEFRVIVEGTPRNMRPMIADEVFLIGREALSNAFRHSRATVVEVELEYAQSHLRLLIRDNGSGIDPEVLRSGKEGHWGLSGMKERTERIGGNLKVMSHAAAGTEVELSVPRRIAFEH